MSDAGYASAVNVHTAGPRSIIVLRHAHLSVIALNYLSFIRALIAACTSHVQRLSVSFILQCHCAHFLHQLKKHGNGLLSDNFFIFLSPELSSIIKFLINVKVAPVRTEDSVTSAMLAVIQPLFISGS